MALRPYQQLAYNAAIKHMRTSVSPCLIDAPTGAGKSHVIAALAEWLYKKADKKVIVLQPNKKLLEQNFEKFIATGHNASIYSASLKQKCLDNNVVFATPLSIEKVVNKIKASGVILDEAHQTTPTFYKIYSELKKNNQTLRVCGLTATPYRLGEGYIYELNVDGEPVEQAKNPFFYKCVYRISAHDLIKEGYLTPPAIGVSEAGYQTLVVSNDQRELDKAVLGQGRKTSKICADIVEKTQNRNGVLIFAASIRHADEIAKSLPKALTGIIVGGQSDNNDKTLEAFDQQKLKYLINVNMLTTGYDASHIDCIALLRATDSVALLQQMIGRSLRLKEGKLDSLILDYAENIERHAPDGDIFNPEITMSKQKESKFIKATCPDCLHENVFSVNPQSVDDMDIDEYGYVIDLNGERVVTEYGDLPAHYGRRCNGVIPPLFDRCGYRWTSKSCEECKADNDVTAKTCIECDAELIDPNEKLREEFTKKRQDHTIPKCEEVVSWKVTKSVSKAGNEMYVVLFHTPYNTVSCSFPLGKYTKMPVTQKFLQNTKEGTLKPKTIKYYRAGKYWTIISYNEEADEIPEFY